MKRAYTTEELERVMRYGVCLVCGTPRRLHRGELHTDHGTTVMWSGIVYDCEHTPEQELRNEPRCVR